LRHPKPEPQFRKHGGGGAFHDDVASAASASIVTSGALLPISFKKASASRGRAPQHRQTTLWGSRLMEVPRDRSDRSKPSPTMPTLIFGPHVDASGFFLSGGGKAGQLREVARIQTHGRAP